MAGASRNVPMQNITQPFVNLSSANAEILTRFAQSPEVVELANSGALKYLELAQQSFGRVANSDAYADLVRRLTENYATFTREYSESLMGMAADGQRLLAEQVQQGSERLAQAGQATVAAVSGAAAAVKQTRAK
jgi:cell division septum initiation protein DivIVA